MMFWLIFIPAIVLAAFGVRAMLIQLNQGLGKTGLRDNFTWGLYIQTFFFFSALAGGLLILISLSAVFEVQFLASLLGKASAASLGCLAAAGLMITADLGKPLRSFKIATAFQISSPMTWDFYLVGLCGVLNLVYVLGLVPPAGVWTKIWGVLCLISALGFVMVHTLFFLSRVEAGFKSEPYMALDVLAHSLWGGAALMAILASGPGFAAYVFYPLLVALTALILMPQLTTYLATMKMNRRGTINRLLFGMDALILGLAFIFMLAAPGNAIVLKILSLLILAAVFFDKAHMVRHFQQQPTLPEPYSQFEDKPEYKPSSLEWQVAGGGLGVFLVVTCAVILLQGI
jgi:Ni/Fe-hydrogenase subunit HybB-like protein